MQLTPTVRHILQHYEGESPGVKQNIARILMHGALKGTGRMMILAVDQGFEHGPRTFVMNPDAFDPHYHFQFAIEGEMSAYAAPLGWLEAGIDSYLGALPTLLKLNSSNSLYGKNREPDQAITASVQDALRLGCSGIGFTIYPGSSLSLHMMEEFKELAAEAKSHGLCVVAWSYPRGSDLSQSGETALDVIAYGAHMACLLGAHIVKVKLPASHLEREESKKLYQNHVKMDTLKDRVEHVVQACFKGRRLVIFSGGEKKTSSDLIEEGQAIHQGGGAGSIIGRNFFQRPREEALKILKEIKDVLKN